MSRVDCRNEQLVVNAVLSGAWPDRCDDTLVAHAAECDVCRDVAGIAALLLEDVDMSRADVKVPAAGQVWWRAAVRARLESTHAATRPMTWMHGITAAIVLGVFLAALTAMWPFLPPLLVSVRALADGYAPSPDVVAAIAGSLRLSAILGVGAAVFMIVAPLAVYFVLSDD